jgi:3-hydroxy-9,10-secoandrosta-1,3,5(10)-triene-9,17-dione monooxygenase reductase component
VPLLPDYSACFECKIANKFEGGDHVILVGEVLRFDDKESRPQVFYRGGYQRL